MAKGGKRAGAGRPKGSGGKRKLAASIAKDGITPLDYMLGVLRDTKNDESQRNWAANAAAPYVHAKLASVDKSIEHSGKVEFVPVRTGVPKKDDTDQYE